MMRWWPKCRSAEYQLAIPVPSVFVTAQFRDEIIRAQMPVSSEGFWTVRRSKCQQMPVLPEQDAK
ncbi:hypothetical protein BFP70_14740 [Thioclava sp. SK-1]|nr:hypothetical protein BFP70_14740 [Thioclava sp. SK-1]